MTDRTHPDSGRTTGGIVEMLQDRVAELEAQLESIGAGGVSGPLMGRTDSKEREVAEQWLRERYGAYRGHFAWRELEEAFLAGRASLAASAGSEPVAWRYVDARGHFRYVGYKPSRDMAAEYPLLKPIRLYLHPSPPEGMVGGWSKGVEAAAALLSKKADDFAQEHGYDDMGGMSFGRGSHADAKLDYHSSLIELAEEVRAMLNTPPTSSADSGKAE